MNSYAVLEKHNVFILSDEIYSENTFSGEHISFAQYEVLRDRLFSFMVCLSHIQ